MSLPPILVLAAVLAAAHTQVKVKIDPAFDSAVAAWHMNGPADGAGKNELTVVGAAALSIPLSGRDRAESVAAGDDGFVARLDGGCLDAGQGTGGILNPAGSALTVAVRLRSPSGIWGGPLFSKHGGHDRLVYNLFSFDNAIGFELGVRDRPGMTQVLVPTARIGPKAWHTLIACYDGSRLRLFVDGVVMDEAEVSGPLRTGNTAPALIGGEPSGSGIKSGWKGEIDYAALWNRALSAAEIERLSGGAKRIAARREQYTAMKLLPRPRDLYREKYRPQFHFTARQWTIRSLNPGQQEEGWLNDPNGLTYLDGEYHLFAQRWAKCWIHAVSRDLIHWTELQPAFWADSRFGRGVQSGGAVVDRDNTSGLSPDKSRPPLVAFWSGFDNHSQCLSYSLDHGRTWTKYAGNPYMLQPERDPKVFWHGPGRRWVMVLSNQGRYDFFASRNLLDWTRLPSSVPDSFECPDIFQLPLDGDMNHMKWVLVRGNGKYSVGEFDGTRFIEETDQFPCDRGPNFYATMSWGDIPSAPGRRIQIAWMRGGKYPDMPFNQQMTFPCDLRLRSTPGGPRIYRAPAPEIALLHDKPRVWKSAALESGKNIPLEVPGDLFHLVAEVEIPRGSEVTLYVCGAKVVLTGETVSCESQPVAVAGGVRKVEMLVDRTSVETFVNEGEVSLSACFLPTDDRLALECHGGGATVRSLTVYPLRSIWAAGTSAGKPADTEARRVEGWTVMVNRALLADQRQQTEDALKLLAAQLREVARVLPAPAVERLRRVRLWFSPEYPGTPPRAEFHPDAGWLREHGRNPAMAGGVEFTNIRIFAAETRRMPCFALHELAHAFHHLALGDDNPELLAAYERAKASGTYDRVERQDSEGRKTFDRAYALTNAQEYFAESTEAYFGRNDFYPYDRRDLEQADPEMCRLLARLWSMNPARQSTGHRNK